MNCCIDANAVVAPVLMRFSFGCGQVLRVFEDISAEMTAQTELEAANAAEVNKSNNIDKNTDEIEVNNNLKIKSSPIENVDKTEVNAEEKNENCTELTETESNNSKQSCKTVITNGTNNSQQTNYIKEKSTNYDQLNDKVKRAEQLDNEETRQSSSDISGYHSDENTDYILNGSIQSGQQNSGKLFLIRTNFFMPLYKTH